MARVTKCDRCGRIFENSVGHTAHVVAYIGPPDLVFDVPAMDLCDKCYDDVLEFLKPIQRPEDKGNG